MTNKLKKLVQNGTEYEIPSYESKSAASGGTDLSLVTTGEKYTRNNKLDSGNISDTAYASSWNGVTTISPSKNAVYDKISAMDTTISGKQDMLIPGDNISIGLLPVGYTQLEYIKNNGTAWVNLGIKIGTSDVVTFDVEWDSLLTVPFFGAYNSGGSYSTNSFVGTYNSSGNTKCFYANNGNAISTSLSKDTRYTLKWNGINELPTLNGTSFGNAGALPYSNFTPNVNAYFFTRNQGGTAGSVDNMTLYRLTVEGKGDFIPAKRNSDSVIGVYDIINDTFITNSGTGTFTAGPIAGGALISAKDTTYTAGTGISISNEVISNSGVTSVNGSTGAVTGLQTTGNLKTSLSDNSDTYYPSQKAVKTAVDGKQAQHTTLSLTLSSSGWSSNTQTVTATGVTASNTVIVSPSPSSFTDYGTAQIYASAQASNSLTFTCGTAPTSNITVNVVILN